MPHPPSPERAAKVERLAQLIENGSTIRQAQEEMGISPPASRAYFKTICDGLGPQALGKWRIEWPSTQ